MRPRRHGPPSRGPLAVHLLFTSALASPFFLRPSPFILHTLATMRRTLLLTVALLSARPLFATCGGGGGGGMGGTIPRSSRTGTPRPEADAVPWKPIGPEAKPIGPPLGGS